MSWASSALVVLCTQLHTHVLDGGRCWPCRAGDDAMPTRRLPQLVCLVLAILVVAGSSSGDAATPGAVAAVEEADSIMGSWMLNLEESDDPRKAMQREQERGQERRPIGNSVTPVPRSVSPTEQQQRIQLSIRNAMSPPFRLEISRTDSTVTLQPLRATGFCIRTTAR